MSVRRLYFAKKMAKFRFIVKQDCNTFSAKLKKGMKVTVDCIANNNPLMIIEDRQKIAEEISKKYNTYCSAYAVNNYFKFERDTEVKLILDKDLTKVKDFIVCNSMGFFMQYIEENGLPDEISFGEKLENKRSGNECLEWLIKYCRNKDFLLDSKLTTHSKDKIFLERLSGLLSENEDILKAIKPT